MSVGYIPDFLFNGHEYEGSIETVVCRLVPSLEHPGYFYLCLLGKGGATGWARPMSKEGVQIALSLELKDPGRIRWTQLSIPSVEINPFVREV